MLPFLVVPPPDPGFELLVASHGMAQGVSQTNGAQIIPRATVRIGPVQIGGQWRNISSPAANGVAAFFLRFDRKLGKAQLDVKAAYRIRTGAVPGLKARAWEFSAGADRRFGKAALKLNAEYSPDEFGKGKSLYVELGPRFEIHKNMWLSGALGSRQRLGGPDYRSFNIGISKVLDRGLIVEAKYFRTNRSDLGDTYRQRIVLSARLAL